MRRARPVTLRNRLIAVLLGCLLLSCATVAIATTIALRHFLLNRLDQQLVAAGGRYAVSLEHPSDNDADNDAQFRNVLGQPAGTLGARSIGGHITAAGIVGSDDRSAVVAASAEALATLGRLGPTTRARTVEVPGLGEYRLIVTRGDDGDLLITGLPEHPVDETISQLLVIEAIVFGSVLVLSASLATVLVRLSLRPLTRVATTALAVAELPLATGIVAIPDRVENPAPGTEVGYVADAVNHMLEHVQSSLEIRQASQDQLRRFVADASHELRTPVAVIRGHAEYAQRVGAGAGQAAPGDEVVHALQRISAESDRMSRLVDDLLLLARLDAGRPLAHDSVDLTRLTLDAVRDAQVAGAEHRWQLDLPDAPVQVRGDEHALHQALANLLSNAQTHTPPASTVTVSIVSAPYAGDPDVVRLQVADDGPGISAELVPRIFERFVHGDDAARGLSGGGGLGLSIVAAIVRAHQGRIEVTSDDNGTVFTVWLPRDVDIDLDHA